MNKDRYLTEHFTLGELCATNAKHINNEPPAVYMQNLVEMAKDLDLVDYGEKSFKSEQIKQICFGRFEKIC